MTVLARNVSYGPANPALVGYSRDGGYLVDCASLEYQIFDVSTDPKRLAPVRVCPPPPVPDRAVVNLVTDRLGPGRYAATWTVPDTEAIGAHLIRWFAKLTPTSPEVAWDEEFDVVEAVAAGVLPGYVTPSECRAQGITPAMASDVRLQQLIAEATRYITKVCGRCFIPTWKRVALDGRGSRNLLLDEPICAIEKVEVAYLDYDSTGVEGADYAVFNRHLSQGLLIPDDRENPKLVLEWANPHVEEDPTLLGRLAWPLGEQNVVVTGVFGYTDPDGSPMGCTPTAIKRVAMLLIYRNLLPLITLSSAGTVPAGAITSERTRDQSVSYAAPAVDAMSRAFTGDAEIDQILAAYRRPGSMGAA